MATKFLDENGLSHFSGIVKTQLGTKANSSDVLAKSNTSPFTPSGDYNPATKKYVDDLIGDVSRLHYQEVDTTLYPTLADFLASTGVEGYVYLYPIDTSDPSKGFYQYIYEGSSWISLGTTVVDLSSYAPLASPALTGTPTAPTATAGTNTTQIATTAFVKGEIGNATITISKNNTTVDSFTTNASSNKTINIAVPTKVSELTNDSGYTTNVGTITGVTGGSGLSGSGSSGTVTINHSNSVTAQTTQAIYPIKIDAQGHISAYGTAVTPVTGSGTSGYLAKYNGANSITSGPQLGSSTSTYLRNDGSWATPTDTDTKVKQSASSTSGNYPILASNQTSPTSGTAYEAVYDTDITMNPTTGNINAVLLNGVTIGNSPKFTDTDTKMIQSSTNTSGNYPILASSVTAPTTGTAYQAVYDTDITMNPTTGNINATSLNGVTIGSSPKFTDTDTKVTQTSSSANANYPILASNQASPTSGTAYQSVYDTDITINPSTGNINATKLNGVTIGSSPKFTDTWQAMTGATSSANGTIGYINAVPPKTGYNTYFWRADGTWASPAQSSYAAGTGLSLSANTFNHSNAVTAQTTQGFYPIKIDAQGHISAYGDAAAALTNSEIDTIWENAS